jgi:hypothetical protein
MAASSDKTQWQLQELVTTLSQAASGERDWQGVARSVASTLNNSHLDWRDLTRAMEQVRGSIFEADLGRATKLLSRTAILAMQLTKGEEHQPSAEVLAACAPGIEPQEMLRNVLRIVRDHIPFDVCSYNEYWYGSGAPDESTFLQSRFAMDGTEPFRWPARWLAIPPELAAWAAGISATSTGSIPKPRRCARALSLKNTSGAVLPAFWLPPALMAVVSWPY